ncbi:hypothetical protein [Caldimonas aquatica]|uniref:DUF998 domain-containing protein n=1 Tax=Caldimonas aquatica TaxID=376175 RepID=A0ABY6MWD3_9BURK|nr:hypothetical protein [Schlegelella aquatica]UZD56325.1 hypothetical protein OMP39_07100 [Schlegelella aquatica]
MRQLKDDLTASLIVMAVLGAVTAVMLLLQAHQVVHSFDLVRDTNAIAGQPPWFGAISNLGILSWAVAAAWYWFAYALARPLAPPALLRCLWLGGSYSAFACLDDLFMIHEHAGQLGLQSGEKVVFGLHALWLVVFVASTLPRIRNYRWLFLGLSLAFFGGSTLVDLAGMKLAPGMDHRDVVLVEEVQKLAGIVFWTLFAMTTSRDAVLILLRRATLHGDPAREGRGIQATSPALPGSRRQSGVSLMESLTDTPRVAPTYSSSDQPLAPERGAHARLD